eukprot:CAMPEP_0174297300 /NCGR_PEP_ID=MMETSP0809-20121228/50614_1 /TAXON_ID=73025 ORGANISM="Eutreptiella gymnastica-like, Strain CCMP1594" /NCGR_SAMPLE_ID=MMETSP0809 /ASSEMBLY_ACC=CAM_ASM_000658 /LENGTH=60 /DNA_ID=CAMNT_0015400999 /DNA_START=1241 /DNA_END=1423 /DNA_ORIENTATION=-
MMGVRGSQKLEGVGCRDDSQLEAEDWPAAKKGFFLVRRAGVGGLYAPQWLQGKLVLFHIV